VFSPVDEIVESDYSGAAFFDALTALGGDVTVEGLAKSSLQGDKVYKSIYSLLENGCPTVSVKDCPDLCPILMVLGAAKNGIILEDTARLKIKESNRADAMATELSELGADVFVEENRITVHPCRVFKKNAVLKGHGDHRIVMALSILLSAIGGEIDDAEAVSKSYPLFFSDLSSLGINVELYRR
jgi:3-phosphoshikimate 1-carboxyvinyltransferase